MDEASDDERQGFSMLTLYHSGTSVCAAKVRLVLAEKRLDWTGKYLDILHGDQFDPAYLKLNPKGVVPTLVHDGAVIRESTVICEYLDEVFPEPPTTPKDPAARAEMRLWTKLVDEELHPVCTVVTFVASHRHTVLAAGQENADAFIDKAPNTGQRERRRAWLYQGFEAPGVAEALSTYDAVLQHMEDALSARTWVAGDEFSLADIALIPYVNRLAMLGVQELWKERRPRLADWFARIQTRASFQPAIYDHMPDGPRIEMLQYGARSAPDLLAALDRAASGAETVA